MFKYFSTVFSENINTSADQDLNKSSKEKQYSAYFESLRSNNPTTRETVSLELAFCYMGPVSTNLKQLFINNFHILLSLLSSDERVKTKQHVISIMHYFYKNNASHNYHSHYKQGLSVFIALIDNEDISIKKISLDILNELTELSSYYELYDISVINKLVNLLRHQWGRGGDYWASIQYSAVSILLNLSQNEYAQSAIISAGALPLILQLKGDYRVKPIASKFLENISYQESIDNYNCTSTVYQSLDKQWWIEQYSKSECMQNLQAARAQLIKPILNNHSYAQSLLNHIQFDKYLHRLIEKVIFASEKNNNISPQRYDAMCELLMALCCIKLHFLGSATDSKELAEENQHIFKQSCLQAIQKAKPMLLSFYQPLLYVFKNNWLMDLEAEINSVNSYGLNNNGQNTLINR